MAPIPWYGFQITDAQLHLFRVQHSEFQPVQPFPPFLFENWWLEFSRVKDIRHSASMFWSAFSFKAVSVDFNYVWHYMLKLSEWIRFGNLSLPAHLVSHIFSSSQVSKDVLHTVLRYICNCLLMLRTISQSVVSTYFDVRMFACTLILVV